MSLCQQYCSLSNPIMISHGLTHTPIPVTFASPKQPFYSIHSQTEFPSHGALEQEVPYTHHIYKQTQYTFPWLKLTSYRIKHYSTPDYITLLHIQNLNNSFSQSYTFQALYPSSNDDSIESIPIASNKPPSNNSQQKYVILFSHGAHDDLGTLLGFLIDLSTQSKLDVISYDYLGVGCSSGKQNANNLFSDIVRVVDFVESSLRYPISNIMLMGESIGCISVANLICEQKYSKIPFIVMISPCLTEDLIEKANHIESTVLIIQGKKDQHHIVKNIERYAKKIKTVWKWYPKNAGRMDLLEKYRKKFILKIKGLIDVMKGSDKILKFDETENSITNDDISTENADGSNKKVKRIQAIKNYVHTEESMKNKGNLLNLKQMPSVKIVVIENQSPNFSDENSLGSGGVKDSDRNPDCINYSGGEDDNIFSLKQDSLNEN